MMKSKLSLPLLFALLAFTTSLAFAQDRSVVVERRDGDMTLQPDGSVDVVETWVVNFQGGPFRSAFRSIPYNRVSSLQFQGVSENGQPYTRSTSEQPNTFQTETDAGEEILRWYFPAASDATRTFQLRYRLTDTLRLYDGGDQFWWKFIEQDRPYPIQAATVTLRLPGTFKPGELRATGYTNARDTGGAQIADGQTIVFQGGPFSANTDWEIRAGFPHGVVTQSIQAWQASEDQRALQEAELAARVEQFNFYSTLSTLLLGIGGGLALLLLYFLRGRDNAVPLNAEFLNAPPSDPPGSGKVLTPALAGALIDEEANVRDVLATLIDWAQRGIITIRARSKGVTTPDPNDDYTYERSGAAAEPLQHAYERALMQRLWNGEDKRNIGYIRQRFTNALNDMFDDLYDELVTLGYFERRPDRERQRFYRLGWLLIVLILPAAFLFQIYIGLTLAPDLAFAWASLAPWFALLLVALAFMYLSRYMPRKTEKGSQAAARWNAFRRYLEHIEKYTNVAGAQDQFEKYLPYAVAFGLDKTWVEKFAAVNTPAPAWYTPPAGSISASASHTPTGSATSTTGPARPFSGGVLSAGSPSDATPGTSATPRAPSLNQAAAGAFTSLNNVSASFFSMLNTTAASFVAGNPGASPGGSSFRSGSSGSSWSSSSSSSGSGSSSGSSSSGGGGGGGGSSGFG